MSVCSKLDHLLYHVLHPQQTEVQQSFLSSIFGLALSTTLCSCFAWIHSTRNTSGKASTGDLRRDVIGILRQQWTLRRGEEKAPGSEGDPRSAKLLWTYHGLPYILGYYANGMMVTITVLYFSEVVKAKDLWTFNLSNLEHPVYMVLACLNVARLLPVLGSLCHEHNL